MHYSIAAAERGTQMCPEKQKVQQLQDPVPVGGWREQRRSNWELVGHFKACGKL